MLGRPAHQTHRAALTFKRHDDQSVLDLGAMRHDRAAYLSAARERIANLESLLLSDLTAQEEDRDSGWDTESLREDFRESYPGEE